MGWLILLLLIATGVGLMWLLGVRGGFLTAACAALVLGASGYALEGQPYLAGVPAIAEQDQNTVALTDVRHAFFGSFAHGEGWLRMSEALARSGESEDAINILQNAVKRYPGDPQLWVGLGNALVDHARGLTPPAEYAYRRATQVAPNSPAGPFFYGLALARSGDRTAAVAVWRQILATAPPTASWRPIIEQGVNAFELQSAASRAASPPKAAPLPAPSPAR